MTVPSRQKRPTPVDEMTNLIYVALNTFRKKHHPEMTAQEVLKAIENVRHTITEGILEHTGMR